MVDCIVQHVTQNSNCSFDKAAEFLIRGFYKKFEEVFATVTIEKGVTPIKQKMDEASVEAMLCEASIKC